MKQIEVNAVVYEYTGYGEANGQIPGDSVLYDDIETVYLYLTENLNIDPDTIILYGRSIGSGPSCFLAEKHPVGGLIIQSGLMSIFRVVLNLRWTLPLDKFPNIDRIPNIDCPVFIIHGTRDEIVPFYHAQEMYKATRHKYPAYFVEGAGHNNVEKFAGDYLKRVEAFITHVDEFIRERNRSKGTTSSIQYDFHDSDEEEQKQEIVVNNGLLPEKKQISPSLVNNLSSAASQANGSPTNPSFNPSPKQPEQRTQ